MLGYTEPCPWCWHFRVERKAFWAELVMKGLTWDIYCLRGFTPTAHTIANNMWFPKPWCCAHEPRPNSWASPKSLFLFYLPRRGQGEKKILFSIYNAKSIDNRNLKENISFGLCLSMSIKWISPPLLHFSFFLAIYQSAHQTHSRALLSLTIFWASCQVVGISQWAYRRPHQKEEMDINQIQIYV